MSDPDPAVARVVVEPSARASGDPEPVQRFIEEVTARLVQFGDFAPLKGRTLVRTSGVGTLLLDLRYRSYRGTDDRGVVIPTAAFMEPVEAPERYCSTRGRLVLTRVQSELRDRASTGDLGAIASRHSIDWQYRNGRFYNLMGVLEGSTAATARIIELSNHLLVAGPSR